MVLASWAFGGAADWARILIGSWGSLALILTIAAARGRSNAEASLRRSWLWLYPFFGFNVLVLLSCLNPSFTPRYFAGQSLLAHTGAVYPWLPSTAHRGTSLEHLWLFDVIYLSGFNLAVAVRRRRALRALLFVAVGNAVLLSVMGTFQSLGSNGLYFGLVPAPNTRFFATFVYGNHWVAYIVLLIAACLGLLFHAVHHPATERSAGSPVAIGIVCLLVMAITPVLAGSRSGTLMILILLGIAVGQALWRLRLRRRAHNQSAAWPVVGLFLCVAVGLMAAAYLGRGAIRDRWQDTRGQWQAGLFGERRKLYADTWHLAAEHPFFGWGLGNYDKALQLTRPRPLEPNRQYEHSYVDAHSDWLQSVAEVGFVGTLLLGLCGLLPLLSLRKRPLRGVVPAYLLTGCALIFLYAAVEFPFGNVAVVIAFWTCFFSAVHYRRLQDLIPMESRSNVSAGR